MKTAAAQLRSGLIPEKSDRILEFIRFPSSPPLPQLIKISEVSWLAAEQSDTFDLWIEICYAQRNNLSFPSLPS